MHELLLDAFARRDPSDAEQLVRIHIRHTRMRLAEHPELFEPPPRR
jgi:DNA-binding GntR family transcriptional regulator